MVLASDRLGEIDDDRGRYPCGSSRSDAMLAPMLGRDVLKTGALLVVTLSGCAETTTQMVGGAPLAVERGYCVTTTQYRQRGKLRSRDSVMKHLERNSHARPYLESGSAYAIGSIVATLVATPTIIVGAYGASGKLKMSEAASTTLLTTGFAAGVASWILCITSDGKYVSAANAYNADLAFPSTDDEEQDPEQEEVQP